MLRFLTKRPRYTEVTSLLFHYVDRQIDAIAENGRVPLAEICRSFYVHDYALGLLLAAARAGKLDMFAARLGFIDYFEKRFGISRTAAASCFKASQTHYAENPLDEGFVDGLVDAASVLALRAGERRLQKRLALDAGLDGGSALQAGRGPQARQEPSSVS